ncbi:cytochrome P450 [Phenylobacterium sp. LjRoot225]|uniref:cytochrome P450 n=1 Tax=Phenylobacterium sp. LjRoot225 TaxID=3342285 RepID=UPI003ECCE8F6
MSAPTASDVLRPRAGGLKDWLAGAMLGAAPTAFSLLRKVAPLPKFGSTVLALLHDDVREVFGTDAAFDAPYHGKLQVITGGEPFFLGLNDGPQYRAQLAAMQAVVKPADLPRLAAEVLAASEAVVAGASGRLEVVDQLVRRVTFEVMGDYLGVPRHAAGDLRAWATRLFEFQFADQANSPDLRKEVDVIAPALRAHLDAEIARRKTAGGPATDDALGRCLALQAAGAPGYSDVEIRTNIVCLFVGGPPQPPMVVPQALEQLLRRPEALAGAQAAARAGDDDLLRGYVLEAMRFDPLAPGLPRRAAKDWTLARGTKRARTVRKGDTVLAAFASAMMDDRRVPDPKTFNPRRQAYEYIHFGYDLHQCFGRHINHATLHLMLKPLLQRPGLRRAPGKTGRLSKNGPFAERLVVAFD